MRGVPEHVTPRAQLRRIAAAKRLLNRVIERDVTADELREADRVLDMIRSDLKDRIAGRAPHPSTGRMAAMR